MKKNEFQELKTKPVEELKKLLGETRDKLKAMKLDLAMGKAKDTSDVRKTRVYVARILTSIYEKSR